MLLSIENELYEKIRQSIKDPMKNGSTPALLTEICQAIRDNADFCKIVLSENGDRDFLLRLIDTAHDMTVAEWRQRGFSANDEDTEMLYSYNVNGSVAVINDWITGGMKKSPASLPNCLTK